MYAKNQLISSLIYIRLLLLSLLLTNCSTQTLESTSTSSLEDNTLTIWWEQGYYTQEDESIANAISQWQQKTGNKVQLSFVDQDSIQKKTENALKTDNPPDLIYYRSPETRTSLWAKDGKLADVSDVIEPLKNDYTPTALQSAYLRNDKTRKSSAYVVPLHQVTVHTHYSRTLLAKAGLKEADIPTEWDAFWDFWKQAQDNLRKQGDLETYAIGFPMSSEANDTYNGFEQILLAYDVNLVDDEGNLLIDNPQVQQGVITALNWYTSFYKEGYVPPDAVDWINRDNNVSFLNQNLLMVINPTLSIPGSQREDLEVYQNQIATIEFPRQPDGESPKYRVSIEHILVFESSPNQQMAKDFLADFMQPEHIEPYLEGALGRFFPVMPELFSAPFWNNPADPHISVAARQFQAGKTVPSSYHLNPAYGAVQAENVWGQAIEKVVVDGVSPQKAALEALTRIQEIFTEWEN